MKKLFLIAPASALLFAGPALAQDFAGARAELRVGWDMVSLDGSFDDGDELIAGDEGESGILVGGEIGYDFAVGRNFILGPYAGLDYGDVERCEEVFGDDEGCVSAGRNLALGVRAGAPVGSMMLLYAKGGYSNGRLTIEYDDFEDILPDFELGENRGGFHLGGGLEMAIGPNGYGKLEYVYTNYNGARFVNDGATASLDGDRHQILIGGGFRF